MKIHEVKQLDEKTWHIDELHASMYLVAGDESALLIDTAYGAGDVRKVIRELTDLPYRVVVTHAHPDHIGGIGMFDQVYMHRADIGVAATTPDYLIRRTAKVLQNYEGELHTLHPGPRFHAVEQGDSFDLGGRILSVWELPGHTFGSIGLLDEASGSLFSGDACNPNQLLALPDGMTDLLTPGCGFTSVRQFMKSLEAIRNLPADKIYTGHLNELGFRPAGKELAEWLMECGKAVLKKQWSDSGSKAGNRETLFGSAAAGNAVLSYHPGHIADDWVIC